MPQEFHVVRCYACQVFQVQQVKKIPKWVCKMCGEKQSLKKEYGRGSGPDCRRHVQKLNTMTGEVRDARMGCGVQDATPHQPCVYPNTDDEYHSRVETRGEVSLPNEPNVENGLSRWQAYIDEACDIDELIEGPLQDGDPHSRWYSAQITLSRPSHRGRGGRQYGRWKGSRKRKREDCDQDTHAESWHPQPSALHKKNNTSFKTSNIRNQENFAPDFQHVAGDYPKIASWQTNDQEDVHKDVGRVSSASPQMGTQLGELSKQKPTCLRNIDSGKSREIFKKRQLKETTRCVSSKWGQFLQDDNDDDEEEEDGGMGGMDFQKLGRTMFTVSPSTRRDSSRFTGRPSSQSLIHTMTTSGAEHPSSVHSIPETQISAIRFNDAEPMSQSKCNHLDQKGSVKNIGSSSDFKQRLDENPFFIEDENLLDEVLNDNW